jgi:drug/metabolite transporter (DMT)-like permease
VTSFMQELGQDVVLFAFISALVFMAGYTVMAPWWRTAIGRARISLDFGIAVALSPTFLHLMFGIRVENSVFFDWYQICAIAFVGCVSLWNLVIVAKSQLERRER